jgi:hypothetical protein
MKDSPVTGGVFTIHLDSVIDQFVPTRSWDHFDKTNLNPRLYDSGLLLA